MTYNLLAMFGCMVAVVPLAIDDVARLVAALDTGALTAGWLILGGASDDVARLGAINDVARLGAALDTGKPTAGWLIIGCAAEVIAIAMLCVFDLVSY